MQIVKLHNGGYEEVSEEDIIAGAEFFDNLVKQIKDESEFKNNYS